MTGFSLRPTLYATAAVGLAVLTAGCLDGVSSYDCSAVANVQASVHGDTVVTTTGLRYRELVAGTGAPVESIDECQTVDARYVGSLTDGTVFDRTPVGTNSTFVIGAGRLIRGFEQGMVGMKVGGRRQLIIPAELGYGPIVMRDGAGNILIPANSTLIFEVSLEAIR